MIRNNSLRQSIVLYHNISSMPIYGDIIICISLMYTLQLCCSSSDVRVDLLNDF